MMLRNTRIHNQTVPCDDDDDDDDDEDDDDDDDDRGRHACE